MSTLSNTDLTVADANITTLKDGSGNHSSTPADVFDGRAKAWIRYNGEGTPAIAANFNANSITDNATADHTVNFTTDLPSADYCVVTATSSAGDGTGHNSVTLNRINTNGNIVAPTAGAFRMSTSDMAGNTTESEHIYAAVFCGDE